MGVLDMIMTQTSYKSVSQCIGFSMGLMFTDDSNDENE